MAARALDLWLDGTRVGQLREEGDVWQLDYDAGWQRSPVGFDLSPALPRIAGRVGDGASRRPVQWYFDNLLPEESLRETIARDAGLPWEDAFGLLAHYGAESAGALVLLPPGQQPEVHGGRRLLTAAALSARIRALPRTSLQRDAPKRMSLAGAQHKLLVVAEDGALYEPEGATPSTHILKPDHPDDAYAASVANELFTMRLAARCGLDVPATDVRFVPQPVFLVQRFDRVGEPGRVRRLHVIDTCQLLDKARTFKYSAATVDSLGEAIRRCRTRALARLQIYRWLVFNVLVGNADNHLKNISWYVDAAGIAPAPFYDLVSTAAWTTQALADAQARWPAVELAIPIGQATSYDQLTSAHLHAVGRALGLSAPTAARELATMVQALPDAAARVLDDTIATLAAAAAASAEPTAAAAHLGVQQRVMRTIVHVVLRDMLARLRD